MVDYPIMGSYREILLYLEIVFTSIILEISLYFFRKYWNNKKNLKPSFVEFEWGILFLGFGFGYISFIIGDFFSTNRELFLTISYLTIGFSGHIFSFRIESAKLINTRYFFTIFTGVLISIFIMTFLFVPSITQTIATIAMFPAYFILILYFLKISRKIWHRFRIQTIGLFLGIFLWMLGFAGTSDMATNLFNGFYIRVVGDIGIIAAMILIGIFLSSIPSLAEIGWEQQVKYIILLTKSGICLYDENFQKKEAIHESILAGVLSALKLYLETTLKNTPKLKVISKGDDVFLIEEHKDIIGVLIVEQELEILKYFLKGLLIKFEEFFSNILKKWNGDLNLFRPAKKIINDIFSIEKKYELPI